MSVPPLRSRPVAALITVLLAVSVSVLSAVLVAPPKAGAATTQAHGYLLKAGPHLGGGTEWMGSYSIDGRPPGYCIDYGKTTPHAAAWSDVRAVPKWSAERFQRISYVLNRYGNTASNTQASAVNAAVNLLIGDPRFAADWRASYIGQLNRRDRAVVPMVNRLVAESAANHGPYRIAVRITRKAPVGGSAQAQVTVTSATRRPLPGVALRISLGNATPAHAVPRATGKNGSATVGLVPTAPGQATVRATASGLIQSSLIRLSSPTGPAVQRLAAAAASRTAATGQATYRASYPALGLKMATACTTDCAGNPPITVTASNPSATDRLQVFPVVNGKPVSNKALTLAPGRKGGVTVVVRDGNKVSLAFRWQTRGRWTRLAAYGRAVVVDCPPGAQVAFLVDCACEGEVKATVKDVNASRYSHLITVVIPGKPSRVMTVAPRSTGSMSGLSWPRGATATVWNQNYLNRVKVGPAVKVTTLHLG